MFFEIIYNLKQQFKVKQLIYFTLQHYTSSLSNDVSCIHSTLLNNILGTKILTIYDNDAKIQ